jgi:hypothetical protein
MKKLLIFVIVLFALNSFAQQSDVAFQNADKLSLGLGMGLDYGGFGANFVYYPSKNLGLFAGAGYAIEGLGVNAGVKVRFNAEQANKIKPYLTAMYGYNAVIVVKNGSEYDKMFYGPTVGAGIDFRLRPGRSGYWTLGLLIPIRGSNVTNYIDDLKNNHGIDFKNELSPIGISFGYRFVIGS